jgi:hypothetical protein
MFFKTVWHLRILSHTVLRYAYWGLGLSQLRPRVKLQQVYTIQYTVHYSNLLGLKVHNRVQWFWLFFTFWGITTHPWHPKGPRIWKLAKKIFKLHAWPAEIFGKNRKMRFFGMISKFNVRSPVWQIFTIFSACFIYGIPNTHIKC